MKNIRISVSGLVRGSVFALLLAVPLAQAGETVKRFSIAVSGGASMGAYEAGLNWGVLFLLRHFPRNNPVLGGETRPIELASVAGASAGGINSILSGPMRTGTRRRAGITSPWVRTTAT